jgi:Zn finger protein HypA/HybF involved in hydrogenase expression
MKKAVLKTKTGGLTIEDYEDLVSLLSHKIKEYKQFSAQWSKWATIREKVEKRIVALHKREASTISQKTKIENEKISWWCMVCEKEHDHAERVLRCPECHSIDIKPMDKYLAEMAKQ